MLCLQRTIALAATCVLFLSSFAEADLFSTLEALDKEDLNSENNDNALKSRKLQMSFQDDFLPPNEMRRTIAMSTYIYNLYVGDVVEGDVIGGYQVELFQRNFEGTDVMIVTKVIDGSVFVVFKGSEEGADWWTNLQFSKDQCFYCPPGVDIHSGFQDAMLAEGLIYDVENKLLELIGTNGNVHVTGHSLGGAMSMILSTYLAQKYPGMSVTKTTFGAPRVGDAAFKPWAESLSNLSMWRWVNGGDSVPRIPTNTQGFYHAGHLVDTYLGRGTIVYYRQVGSDDGYYAGPPNDWYYGFNVFDHSSTEYQAVINKKGDGYHPQYFTQETPECPWWNPLCWFIDSDKLYPVILQEIGKLPAEQQMSITKDDITQIAQRLIKESAGTDLFRVE